MLTEQGRIIGENLVYGDVTVLECYHSPAKDQYKESYRVRVGWTGGGVSFQLTKEEYSAYGPFLVEGQKLDMQCERQIRTYEGQSKESFKNISIGPSGSLVWRRQAQTAAPVSRAA